MAESNDAEKEILTWEGYGNAARELAHQVVDSGFVPDLILCVARGGLPVGGAVAYAMGIKNCFAISVEYYTGINERLDLPVILAPELKVEELKGLNVLVVDDVADTGNTLNLVMRTCEPQVSSLKTAVLYFKPQSVVKPDFIWKETDKWIVFPWSAKPGILESVRDA